MSIGLVAGKPRYRVVLVAVSFFTHAFEETGDVHHCASHRPAQYVDLRARLDNAAHTERRLSDLLRDRTGKLPDVLAVEQELARVRGEIEQMEAERKNMANQLSYATLRATITEDYQAQLQVVPPSTFTRLGNAAVEGYRGMVDGVVGLALFLLSIGPSLVLWGGILFLPARLGWKKVRRSFAG